MKLLLNTLITLLWPPIHIGLQLGGLTPLFQTVLCRRFTVCIVCCIKTFSSLYQVIRLCRKNVNTGKYLYLYNDDQSCRVGLKIEYSVIGLPSDTTPH